ncbi:MAG TPA: molybdopterin-dependent oxidoreductase [Gemmatimonadales bacterium]|nr:molybdopterin-dependent oxidoreductase [Gemmatimonadales bacterium]
MERRRFLQVAGAAGIGVAAGCSPVSGERMLPYVNESDELIPGIPEYYASTCRECPAGCGIVVKTREARAIKVEGNPLHPIGHGHLCARGQAALQGLYDPDRVRQPLRRSARGFEPVPWDEAIQAIGMALGVAATSGPERVALVTGADSGTLDAFYDEWLAAFRSRRRLRYEPFAYEPLKEASQLTFGVAAVPEFDFAAARYVLSFGADFLETWLSPVEYARQFAAAHRWQDGAMAKFVAVEPRRGLTGFNADAWIAPKPGSEGLLALGIAAAVVRHGKSELSGAEADRVRGFLARFTTRSVSNATGVAEDVIERVAREFAAARPSLAVAGGVAGQHRAATQTAAAVNLLNYVAGNVGRTVRYHATSPWDRVSRYRDAVAWVAAMRAGSIDVAIVQGPNPAFSLPRSVGFADAFRKVGLKVALASHLDETAELCDYVLPDLTPLEQWGVVEPAAGVRSFVQPAMTPVFDGTRQAADVLLAIAARAGKAVGRGATSARELVAAGVAPGALDRALQHGGEFATAPARAVRLVPDFARLSYQAPAFDGDAAAGLVLVVYPSASLFDGRGANKGWLQELPDAATKIAWQTWVEVNPATAARLGVANGDVVTVTSPHGSVEALVYLYPGVRPDVVAMPVGQGHRAYGRTARGRGANPLELLGADATDASGALAFCSTRVTLAKTGRWQKLATTEGSPRQLGRGIARAVSVAGALAGRVEPGPEATLSDAERAAVAAAAASQRARAEIGIYAKPNPKWEMVIDLSRCTGCQACVTACYAENNIPVVGEEQTLRHRGMAWMRLERYFEGDTSSTDFQVRQIPMLCQQCELAPCEPVCPVYASYHTPDGLNGQVYNRCVGTRYCANNCPYKVRYFNWWDYGREQDPYFAFAEPLNWQLNPDVTVRTKGVMEKCTFCVQRIRFAQNDAKVRKRDLADGDITPACAQTCPADAILFGDAHDPASRVSRRKTDARGYHALDMLNAKPGITYLERVIATEGA